MCCQSVYKFVFYYSDIIFKNTNADVLFIISIYRSIPSLSVLNYIMKRYLKKIIKKKISKIFKHLS